MGHNHYMARRRMKHAFAKQCKTSRVGGRKRLSGSVDAEAHERQNRKHPPKSSHRHFQSSHAADRAAQLSYHT